MAAFIPVPNTAELVIEGQLAGQQIINVVHFLYAAAPTGGQLASLCVNAELEWTSNVQATVSEDYELVRLKATDLTTVSGPTAEAVLTTPEPGGYASPSVPLNVALVISFSTDLRGRSYRGRLYHAGVPSAALLDAGRMENTARTATLIGWTTFFTSIESSLTVTHVVVSRRNGGAPRVTGVATQVTGYSANEDLDSMRSRLVGRGS